MRVDDGSSARVSKSQVIGNGQDVTLTFAARGDFRSNTIGSLSSDGTALVRGDVTCR